MIETEELKKTYKQGSLKVKAVDNVNLKISDGEFTAIVGPSGSGKTTLLNCIGGLDNPTSGKVIIDGELISSYSSNQMIKFRLNNIGFVFQSYNLIPVLTAKENIEMVMLMQGYNKQDMEKRSSDLLNEVGMGDMSKRRPAELSGGQQQRVAVARSLASKPKFILADEPTANLDSKSTAKLLDIMSRLNKQENITFVFSTHDQRVIDRARRVVTLEDGKIIKDIKK
ncbi:MAG: ABC transporter ATP-binding protein [Flavobacteriaceae bacterium]|jgi:putative ABC transport system ATP-binding protein|nr:ABC transporter ATP-binding protein [Flavobacteriaceae bacterium]MBT4112434.1 ABC transporter ATP-binding protein [Flavobacteriaceae bacterium]MBT4614288.1 ABC transporter ATP-binding protein [Flavobacteriaceae bacterium]MBT5246741.1 ABC transporter ATP-binding protein [Flavobacteriaceae bacterium]MBT5649926.1 ABC transporter ATP-binding protein [Flavobacteriaceae bacterium]